MKSFISKVCLHIARDRMLVVAILILSGVLVAGVVSAATTISTDIATGGYLSVTGTATTSSFAGPLSVGTSTNFTNGLFSVGTSSPLFYVDKLTGYLGIGTSSPTMKLSLWGSGTNGFFGISSTTQGDIFTVNSNGYIGIGTSSPITQLHVAGKIPTAAVASVATGNSPTSVVISGRYIYVANYSDSTFKVFDISNPLFPVNQLM